MNDATFLAFARPDYLLPGLVVVVAFHALWLTDRDQRHDLLFGIGTGLSAIVAGLAPVGGIPAEIGTPRRAAMCLLVSAMTLVFVAGAASFRGGTLPLRALARVAGLAAVAALLVAKDTWLTLLYLDLIALLGFLSVGWILWPLGGVARLAALLFVVRALKPALLTVVIPGYGLVERIAFNQVLGFSSGVVLLSASCLRVLRDLGSQHAQLERLVQARSAALLASRTRLERANRDLGVFTDCVVDALREPLEGLAARSIRLSCALETMLSEEGRIVLRRLCAAVTRMRDMVEGLFALAHIANHRLQREPVDVSALAAEVFGQIGESRPGMRPLLTIAPAVVVQADRLLLRIVLDNLLGNAWKYSARAAQPRIALDPLPEGGAGFVVRDNGAGFDPRYAHKLFAPFQRLHDARECEGTGVGLATVQRVVLRHGGRIRAEGAPGQGAAFFVSLPEADAPPPEPGRVVSR